jgi:hypothetical protein
VITNEDQDIEAVGRPLEIVWRNPLNFVQAQLKARETSHPYYQWAHHGRKIRARGNRWDLNHRGRHQARIFSEHLKGVFEGGK